MLVLWFHDSETGAIDLQRTAWVAQGYADRALVEPGALTQLIDHFWRTKLADLWILDEHYLRGKQPADDLLPSTFNWLRWLAEHRRAFGEALEAAVRHDG